MTQLYRCSRPSHCSKPRHSRARRSRGATTVEYAMLVGIVVAIAIGSWRLLGHRIKCALGFASAQIAADGSGQGTCANDGAPEYGHGRPVAAP